LGKVSFTVSYLVIFVLTSGLAMIKNKTEKEFSLIKWLCGEILYGERIDTAAVRDLGFHNLFYE